MYITDERITWSLLHHRFIIVYGQEGSGKSRFVERMLRISSDVFKYPVCHVSYRCDEFPTPDTFPAPVDDDNAEPEYVDAYTGNKVKWLTFHDAKMSMEINDLPFNINDKSLLVIDSVYIPFQTVFDHVRFLCKNGSNQRFIIVTSCPETRPAWDTPLEQRDSFQNVPCAIRVEGGEPVHINTEMYSIQNPMLFFKEYYDRSFFAHHHVVVVGTQRPSWSLKWINHMDTYIHVDNQQELQAVLPFYTGRDHTLIVFDHILAIVTDWPRWYKSILDFETVFLVAHMDQFHKLPADVKNTIVMY